MANTILNFHFDYLNPSLTSKINIYTKGTFSSKRILPHFPLCPQLPQQLIIIRCAGNLPPADNLWSSPSSSVQHHHDYLYQQQLIQLHCDQDNQHQANFSAVLIYGHHQHQHGQRHYQQHNYHDADHQSQQNHYYAYVQHERTISP